MSKTRKVCEIFIDGLYFHVRSNGINYKYIEPNDLMDFISHVVINAALTTGEKKRILSTSVKEARTK